MTNKFKDIDIKDYTYYFFDDMIDVKNTDPNKMKIGGNSYKNTLICYVEYVAVKD